MKTRKYVDYIQGGLHYICNNNSIFKALEYSFCHSHLSQAFGHISNWCYRLDDFKHSRSQTPRRGIHLTHIHIQTGHYHFQIPPRKSICHHKLVFFNFLPFPTIHLK